MQSLAGFATAIAQDRTYVVAVCLVVRNTEDSKAVTSAYRKATSVTPEPSFEAVLEVKLEITITSLSQSDMILWNNAIGNAESQHRPWLHVKFDGEALKQRVFLVTATYRRHWPVSGKPVTAELG